MKTELTKEEILIEFFNHEFENSNTNEVYIYRNNVSDLSMSEPEVARTIHLLDEEKIIIIKNKPVQGDFSIPWTIILKSGCVNYFKIKKEIAINKRNNWIQFWIPVSISIAALTVSIVAIII